MAVALFRCDASPSIGAGHVMRCLATAETLAWASWRVGFVSGPETLKTVPALARTGFPMIEGSDGEKSQADLIVFDHYGIDAAAEKRIAGDARLRVAFEDQPTRAHDVDFLVDPTPGRHAQSYDGLVRPDTQLLEGACYVQLRQQWRKERAARVQKSGIASRRSRVLVSMGSTDPANATAQVLVALGKVDRAFDIDVILGPAAPHIAAIRAMTAANMRLHVDPSDLPELVAGADLAIGAAGSSCFERACLGVPSIIVVLADNQTDLAAAFDDAGAARLVTRSQLEDFGAFASLVSELLADDAARETMSIRAAALVDGRGVQRLLLRLAGHADVADGIIRLRAAEEGDRDWMFELQCLPETRRFSRNPTPPTVSGHVAWYARTLNDPDRLLAVIENGSSRIGLVRLDRMSDEDPTFEVSIAISPDWHGKGVGAAALKLVRRIVPSAGLLAVVHPGNHASQALFAKAGYRREAEDRFKSSVP